jgi:hypothetical protein
MICKFRQIANKPFRFYLSLLLKRLEKPELLSQESSINKLIMTITIVITFELNFYVRPTKCITHSNLDFFKSSIAR